MSSNARKWFYHQPEPQPYLVTERLNSTFWVARVVGVYWKCVKADPPLRARGYFGDHVLQLDWTPGEWLALRAPREVDLSEMITAITQRILMIPASLTYVTHDGQRVTEWHVDGGQKRWSEIQGHGEFLEPRRL